MIDSELFSELLFAITIFIDASNKININPEMYVKIKKVCVETQRHKFKR